MHLTGGGAQWQLPSRQALDVWGAVGTGGSAASTAATAERIVLTLAVAVLQHCAFALISVRNDAFVCTCVATPHG